MSKVNAAKPVVFVTALFNRAVAAELEEQFDVRYQEPNVAGDSLVAAGYDDLSSADVLVAELDGVDEATLQAAPNIKLIVDCRAAPVNVDIAACTRRGIPVVTTPGRNADCTADFAFSLLLTTVRKTSASEAWMRAGGWVPSIGHYAYEAFRGMTLRGHTLGVIGGGAVGSRMVARAVGFGLKVLVHDPFLPQDAFGDDATMVGLDELMASSDIVSVHIPENPQTLGFVTREHMALMKPTAFFIVAGRWATIDGDALIDMLREQRIAGAGIDVFDVEPLPLDSELFTLPNVTITPHIAGASDGVIDEQTRMSVEAIFAWRDGRPLRAVANGRDLNQ